MREFARAIARTPFVGPLALRALRARIAWSYFSPPLGHLTRWLFSSRETANFTYHLQETNKRYLASLLVDVVGTDYATLMRYFEEIETDERLRTHVAAGVARSDWAFMADTEVRLGRRIGWYAIARAIKPRLIVETGVDKGLGGCVLVSALERNALEGHTGRYEGIDINPKAGYLLSGPYAALGRVQYGDAVETLRNSEEPIDLYISDSDHSAAYEAAEYEAVTARLSSNAIILGDNSHVTDKLLDYSLRHGRRFVFFREQPVNHWYPGGGIGISYIGAAVPDAAEPGMRRGAVVNSGA